MEDELWPLSLDGGGQIHLLQPRHDQDSTVGERRQAGVKRGGCPGMNWSLHEGCLVRTRRLIHTGRLLTVV